MSNHLVAVDFYRRAADSTYPATPTRTRFIPTTKVNMWRYSFAENSSSQAVRNNYSILKRPTTEIPFYFYPSDHGFAVGDTMKIVVRYFDSTTTTIYTGAEASIQGTDLAIYGTGVLYRSAGISAAPVVTGTRNEYKYGEVEVLSIPINGRLAR